ncbi:hypothetical protein OG21DRAFT_1510753 [Imleria badia]|nr:hypothetical protein OG21DRAFT_1510753 [Imleria badia]
MSTSEHPVLTVARPAARAATHPFRVYGYKVTHEWVWKFGRDHNLEKPGISEDTLESAVFQFLMFRLPGLQRHFLDDPSDTEFGYSHCLSIANNWNPKKIPLVDSRLEQWKTVLGMEEKPRWYIPTRHTIPRR